MPFALLHPRADELAIRGRRRINHTRGVARQVTVTAGRDHVTLPIGTTVALCDQMFTSALEAFDLAACEVMRGHVGARVAKPHRLLAPVTPLALATKGGIADGQIALGHQGGPMKREG